ncbi:MAG: ABC transporter permease, partial [Halolamina sp.]
MTRWRYFARRLVLSIPILIFGTTATFWILRMGPIDPAAAIIGPDGDQEAYEQIRDQLGLDEPLWEQYIDFMVGMFTGDFGQSWVLNPDTPSAILIQQYAPRTMWLGFWSVLIAIFVGIPLGFYAGLNSNSWSDYLASFGGIVWRAMPNFWLAVILVSVLSQSQQLFGISWQHLLVRTNVVTAPPLNNLGDPWELLRAIKWTLPAAIVLGSSSMGNEMRIGRTAILETKNSNYVEAAKARGIPGRSLVWKHIFRNALVPLVPIITGEAFLLIGGSVLVETVFAINGLGY